jgi:hypothetical protein
MVGLCSQDKLLTNYPLGDFRHPTRASLMPKEERRREATPSTHKMHFGKHKGKTVEEVHKEDKGVPSMADL